MSTAVIKLIYNTGQPATYGIKFRDEHIYLDLHMQSLPGDFLTMTSRIRDEIIFKKSYRVIFNNRGIPAKYANTKEFLGFKESLIKYIGKSDTPNLDTWLEIVKLHVARGKSPELSEYNDPTVLARISNYMESILNCKITRNQVILLCQELIV